MNIKVIYSPEHIAHNPQFEIYDGVQSSYAEKPERLISIVNALKAKGVKKLYTPQHFSTKNIYSVHQKAYVQFLQKRSQNLHKNAVLYPSYFIMDTYTPIVPKTFQSARCAVDVVLTGAKELIKGEQRIYSLCRPPGHHAEHKTMGGYCYFNNAAIAGNYLSKYGTVAILDIDFHHGNGTQNIFYKRADVLYVSLHADPREKFPYNSGFVDEIGEGKGIGYNKNYPLPLGTNNEQYMQVLRKALSNISDFNPRFLVVSVGFDTYEKDPIGGFLLTMPFYTAMGREIAKIKKPTLLVQEGGYTIKDLGQIAIRFLEGICDE